MAETISEAGRRPGATLVGATVLSLPLGSIYAYSVFLAPLEHLLNANRSELASVFGISVVFFTLGMNLVPRLFGRMSVPWIMGLVTVLAAAGVGLASVARTYQEFAVGYGVLFSFGGGMGYVAAQQSVNATPLRHPGLVNGYLVSLFPLGAMISAPLFGWGIATLGVRSTLVGLSVVVAICGLAATASMVRSGVRLAAPHEATARSAPQVDRQLRVTFWKLFLVFLFAASAGLMVLSQAAGILAAYGTSKAVALAATTAITAAIAAARLGGGWLVDRYPVPVVAAGAHLFALAGAILLTAFPTAEMSMPALGMIGTGYGIVSGLTAGAVAFYWPKALFGRTAGRVYIAWCLAALALPVAAAHLYDLTGGYRTAMLLAGSANLIGALVGLTLPRAKPAR